MTLGIVTICNAVLKRCSRNVAKQLISFNDQVKAPCSKLIHGCLIQWTDPTRFWIQMVLDSSYAQLCCQLLKFLAMSIHPTTCRNSKIRGVMFPFGAIGAWSKAQRAEWQFSALQRWSTQWLQPVSSFSFHVFRRNNFCSAPFRLCLFLVGQ